MSLFLDYKEMFEQDAYRMQIEKLQIKMRNKKVLFYSCGVFFDALSSVYDLNKYFNVVGVSDLRYETEDVGVYKNFKCIKPFEIKNYDIDFIIVSSPNFNKIKEYLLKNKIFSSNSKIISLERKDNLSEKINISKRFYKETNDIFKTLKYFLVCDEEECRTKLNYEKVLKKLKTLDKIRVVFVCEENSKWGYQSLYDLMIEDSRFEVLPVVLYPIKTSTRIDFTQENNKVFFEKYGVKTVDGYNYEKGENINLKEFKPDILFYQQPWYLEGKNHPTKVSEYALTFMIPYGYTTLNPKSWGTDSVKRVYSTLYTFFSESKYHNTFYEKAANMRFKDNLLATGTPKLDGYYSINPVMETYWKGDKLNRKPHIIWAPHHSFGSDGLKMATFDKNYDLFYEYAKKHTEYSFILKPHPALKNACVKYEIMTESEYDKYIESWNNLSNAQVYDSGTYIDIFRSSDLLITDCSSFFAEYFPTKNPIIFLNRKDRAPFDKFGNTLKKTFYEANEFSEVENLIYKLLEIKEDGNMNLRLKLNKKFFSNDGRTSAQKILSYIYKII